MPPTPAFQLAVALGLGLLVGLQRERADSAIARSRTFPLITVSGLWRRCWRTGSGSRWWRRGWWSARLWSLRGTWCGEWQGEADPSQTTEFTAVVMYCIGSWVMIAQLPVAIALAGTIAVLLHLREPLHRWGERMGDRKPTLCRNQASARGESEWARLCLRVQLGQ
jgi:hypothetical protein